MLAEDCREKNAFCYWCCTQEQNRLRKKTKILLEILTAGKDVEDKIAEHSDEIDQLMLDVLDRRAQAAIR